MDFNDYDYHLPAELIAQQPPAERTASRLLTLDGASGALADRRFVDLPQLLRAGDLLVLNNTRVIPARLFGHKASGGKVELLVERLLDKGRLLAQVRASRAPKAGAKLLLGEPHDLAGAEVLGRQGELFELRVDTARPLAEWLERAGQVPLPPYIRRPVDPADRDRYQTVFARRAGAVAAPTAGLHFDRALLAELSRRGVEQSEITLHVGAGTFRPPRSERVENHVMHAERVTVDAEACRRIAATRRRGGRVVAVGTTVVRSLEAACLATGEPRPLDGETDLFIYPGYRFRCVDLLVTNFHLPRSTLLLLVAAFAGRDRTLAAYRHAVEQSYRFFSYGDAMLVSRAERPGKDTRPA